MVAPPKDGALAGIIHKNVRWLAGAAGCRDEMGLDAKADKYRGMQIGRAIFADLADVARAKSPWLASDDGGGDLAARQGYGGSNFDFAIRAREVVMKEP